MLPKATASDDDDSLGLLAAGLPMLQLATKMTGERRRQAREGLGSRV